MLVGELAESYKAWEDLEMEETQVKLDLSDMVMREIINETVDIIRLLEGRKIE